MKEKERVIRKSLDTDQKALEINLEADIYGSFAEIGAGQEVARYFFKVGAAAGTIAKTMSAYDKVVSDDIYGESKGGRYVSESRLYDMLNHEYTLMSRRLEEASPQTNLFAFADTVRAKGYSDTGYTHGWLGLRFQLKKEEKPNDFILHVKMLDNSNLLQQQAIGILGVNMIYAAFHYYNDPETLIESLTDSLDNRVVIDMIRLTGPSFEDCDNRLLSLYLVKHGLTEVAMITPDKGSIHASEFLYRKSLMVVRGHYRPPTVVSDDAFKSSFKQFLQELGIEEKDAQIMPEITLSNLRKEGKIRDEDFLARAELLNALGHHVIISDCDNHQRLIYYLSDMKIQNLALVIGVRELLHLITEEYENNKDGKLLSAFGELFMRHIKVYGYPALNPETNEVMTASKLPVPEGIYFLYKYLIDSNLIVEIKDYNEKLLHILPHELLTRIQADEEGWESFVPEPLGDIIKDQCLLDYPCEITDFEY